MELSIGELQLIMEALRTAESLRPERGFKSKDYKRLLDKILNCDLRLQLKVKE